MRAELQRLTDRAAAESLLDVAYTTMDSPFGTLLLATTPRGLVRLGLPNQDAEELLEDLADRVSPRVLEAPAPARRGPPGAGPLLRGQARRASTSRSTGDSPTASAARCSARSPASPTARPATTPRWRERRQRTRRPRRRHRLRLQPTPNRRPLPPSPPHRRRPRRLWRRAADEESYGGVLEREGLPALAASHRTKPQDASVEPGGVPPSPPIEQKTQQFCSGSRG